MSISTERASRYAFPALLLSSLFLAFGPLLVRESDVGPVAAAFWRVALAIPPLLLLTRFATKARLSLNGAALPILLAGLFFAADLAAWHYGIVRTKMANATLFGNSSTFLFALYGFVVMRALPTASQIGALVLAVVGAALLLGSSYELSRGHLEGDLLAILAGIFYAFYLIAIDHARKTMAALPLLVLSTLASTLPLLLAAASLGERIVPEDWTPLVLLSLGSQVIGQGLLVFAIGWLIYDERLGPPDMAGAALVCIALVLIRLPERLALDDGEPHLEEDRSAR